MFKKQGRYTGPVCYVPFDHKGPDGKDLRGGWHYSTRVHSKLGEIPDAPLHLNTDGGEPFYEHAEKHHQSWLEKHGPGNVVQIGG